VFEDFDELARGLAENDISRGQALKWAGYGMLGAALSSVGFADTAEALSRRKRRRCRRKGGTPLEEGDCHCAAGCGDAPDRFSCQGNPQCWCIKTTEGTGFCADRIGLPCASLQACTSSSECPSNYQCTTSTCCATPVCMPACPSV
jgi:hypothetical protein